MTAPLAVSIPEACRLLGIGRSKLYALFAAGKIRPRKCGKKTLLLVAELDEFLRALPAGGSAHDA